VVPDKQFYHCFGCGAHGNVLRLSDEYDHLSFVEAIEDLAGRLGLTFPARKIPMPNKASDDLYTPLERARCCSIRIF